MIHQPPADGHRRITRRALLASAVAGAAAVSPAGWLLRTDVARASTHSARPIGADQFDASVVTAWYDLVLRLIQNTPGYSPPVASRALGCVGVTLYEAILPGISGAVSLGGQLNGLAPPSPERRDAAYHWPTVANAAMAASIRELFPTAPSALLGEVESLEAGFESSAPRGIALRSVDRGRAVATRIADWSRTDGGHEGYLRNFPSDYTPPTGPGLWVPTPPGFLPALQPYWGRNRCMALSSATACEPGPHPAFSTTPGSAFFDEAVEVYEAVNELTPAQLEIARFWADDPGATATPPGHSVAILTQLVREQDRSLAFAAEAYARVGIAVCDAFIACWHRKYVDNLLRPITFVRAHIDPRWGDPLPLTTPPFPEYPSGHSVQSGASAVVLTSLFGAIPFTDHTHDRLGLAARSFSSFDEAAEEAAISRLYGGIHYRAAIDRGLAQGRCIGSTVAAILMA